MIKHLLNLMSGKPANATGIAALIVAVLFTSSLAAVAAVRRVDPTLLPNRRLTPGAVLPVTLEQIRQPRFSDTTRDVDDAKRHEVARRYGWPKERLHACEVDHLIPASWGGASTVENLWPEPYAGPWNARVKDRLEVHGLALIRAGKLDLKAAQAEIAHDWIAMYRRLIGPRPVQHASQDHEQ